MTVQQNIASVHGSLVESAVRSANGESSVVVSIRMTTASLMRGQTSRRSIDPRRADADVEQREWVASVGLMPRWTTPVVRRSPRPAPVALAGIDDS